MRWARTGRGAWDFTARGGGMVGAGRLLMNQWAVSDGGGGTKRQNENQPTASATGWLGRRIALVAALPFIGLIADAHAVDFEVVNHHLHVWRDDNQLALHATGLCRLLQGE